MSKFLYPIYKLKTKSYIKWWLYHKKAGGSGILSEILTGTEFYLEDTVNRNFNLFQIYGRSEQESTTGYNIINITNAVNTTNQGVVITGDTEKQLVKFAGIITSTYCTSSKLSLTEPLSTGTFRANFKSNKDAFIVLRSANDTWLRSIQSSNNTAVDISTLSEPVAYLQFGIEHFTNGANVNCEVGYQLSSGSDLKPYEPYTGGQASPNPSYPQEIHSTGDSGSVNETISNSDNTESQNISIPTQQPMRSIGDVRDCFVKKSDGWYERHMPYIASYNGETLPRDVYNEVDNVKYCNEKSMSTTGQFSIGASVQYIDENNWNDLPCTEEQVESLEALNKARTYKPVTHISSTDETPAYLKIQYYKEG